MFIKRDEKKKLKVYRESGAREYWIADLLKEAVTVFDFTSGEEVAEYCLDDIIGSKTIEGLKTDFSELKKYLRGIIPELQDYRTFIKYFIKYM